MKPIVSSLPFGILLLLDGRIARQYQAGENKTAYQFVNSIPKDRYKPKAEPGPIKKSLNSLGEIGNDFTTAWEERSDKARDSLYEFGNHLTFGAFDMGKNVWEGNQALYQKKMNSPADFANWLSMGSVDMVRGVISPDEQFSKEHWQNSFELFTIVAGGGLAKVNTGPTPKPVHSVRVPKKPINMPVKQWVSQLKPPVIKSVTNKIEWFRANFLNVEFQRRQFAVDMPGAGRGASDTRSRAEIDGNGGSGARGTNRSDIETKDVLQFQKYKDSLTKGDVLENSKAIIPGSLLNDLKVIKELTKDGGSINDWAKMESLHSYNTSFGQGKVHYYRNLKTGEVSYYDAKIKVAIPKDLKRRNGITSDFWVIDVDNNFVPTGVRP